MISLPRLPVGSPKLLWGRDEIWPDWSSSQPHKLQKHLGLSPQPPSFFMASESIYVTSSRQQPEKGDAIFPSNPRSTALPSQTLLRPNIPNMTWFKEKHDWHGEWLSKTLNKSHPFYKKTTQLSAWKTSCYSFPSTWPLKPATVPKKTWYTRFSRWVKEKNLPPPPPNKKNLCLGGVNWTPNRMKLGVSIT